MDSGRGTEFADCAFIAGAIRMGDKDAEKVLCARFRKGVVLMLRRRLTDRWLAEDIANDALSHVLTFLREQALQDPDKLSAYIHGTALKLAFNANRKVARHKTETDTETVEAAPDALRDPAIINMRESLARAVRKLLATLPVARDREVLIRYYLNEEDKEEIRRDLQLSEEHFDRVLHRARRRMRALVEDAEPHLRAGDFAVML